TDNTGGSGVKQITYSASGAQPIASTPVNGATATVSLTTEGTTFLSYSAKDNAGNTEGTKILSVKIDKTVPTASSSVSPTPHAAGYLARGPGRLDVAQYEPLAGVHRLRRRLRPRQLRRCQLHSQRLRRVDGAGRRGAADGPVADSD